MEGPPLVNVFEVISGYDKDDCWEEVGCCDGGIAELNSGTFKDDEPIASDDEGIGADEEVVDSTGWEEIGADEVDVVEVDVVESMADEPMVEEEACVEDVGWTDGDWTIDDWAEELVDVVSMDNIEGAAEEVSWTDEDCTVDEDWAVELSALDEEPPKDCKAFWLHRQSCTINFIGEWLRSIP